LQSDFLLGEPDGLIGIDEAGKGDYFGPLVVAACFSNEKIDIEFGKIGLKESKNISDYSSFILDKKIRKLAPYEIVVIGPEKYNELHKKMRNLNRLLAWGHSRALENLLAKTNPFQVVADQFGDKSLIENALMKKGRQIKLIQKHKAESVPAVAAASVLARAEFLRRLEKLSNQYGVSLHKGAGPPTDEDGKRFVANRGKEELAKVAKVHFKNTARIIGR
jgi:ribonuclease HIII